MCIMLNMFFVKFWVGELLIGFHDVAILPSRTTFSTAFLENCSRGETLGTTPSLEAVVGVSKGMFPIKSFQSNNVSLGVSRIS